MLSKLGKIAVAILVFMRRPMSNWSYLLTPDTEAAQTICRTVAFKGVTPAGYASGIDTHPVDMILSNSFMDSRKPSVPAACISLTKLAFRFFIVLTTCTAEA